MNTLYEYNESAPLSCLWDRKKVGNALLSAFYTETIPAGIDGSTRPIFEPRESSIHRDISPMRRRIYIYILYIYIIILLSGETRGWKVETSRLDRSSRGEIFAPRNYFRIFVFAKVIRKFGKTFEISNRSLHFNLENHLYFISRNNFCPISSHS